ncbi:dimethylamine corrinoid protein [Anaerosolibacter carboniphilus]|uniref:Dimethylamine corrinoid protein n=1 Tax=Anaerosolibacter carboniphilus TaxID=1417629 RepID=A0A841L829_9FIRM|nr:corrinoid protein [Anaerosolibacter carboniphilus]MBB6218549.1 dimethylamine corrinoid protein [Anaerosolibacter carboniphilus]
MNKETILKEIRESLVEMEEEKVVELCEKTLELNIPAYETITNGLIPGMDEVSRLYEEEEYFLPEVLVCSDVMNAGLDIVKPHLDKSSMQEPIKVVMGVVEGDTHDIGKNLVRIMMEASGMEVHDLGRDVPLEKFIEKAEEVNADLIGMSTLMTTTMDGMKTVIDRLSERNIRNKYKILVGGGPISQNFADRIGADLYTKDASEAVRRVKEIFRRA